MFRAVPQASLRRRADRREKRNFLFVFGQSLKKLNVFFLYYSQSELEVNISAQLTKLDLVCCKQQLQRISEISSI